MLEKQLQKTLDLACESAAKLLQTSHSAFLHLAQDGLSGTVVAEYPHEVGTLGTVIPIAGVPLEERLVSVARPIRIADIDNEPNFDPVATIMRGFGIRSAIMVPVVVNGRMIGSFSLDSVGSPRLFSDEEIERCSLFAMQVQMALENAFLFEESRHTRERLDLMLRANQVLLEGPDLSGLASMIADLPGLDFCRILLLDESRLSLVVKAGNAASGVSWDPGIGGYYLLPDSREYNEFLTLPDTQVLYRTNDVHCDWLDATSRRLQLPELVQSLLVAPLRCRDAAIGLLEIGEWHGGSNPFDGDRIGLVSALASQAAVQIENRRNQELSERRRYLLETFERHSENLVAEREPDKILQETVRLGRGLICGAAAGLFRSDPTQLTLIHAIGVPNEHLSLTIPAGEGVIGTVSREGQPRLTFRRGDWGSSDRWFSSLGFDSVAAVPLAHLGNVAFVLFVAQNTSSQRFGQAELEILARLGGRAVAAWNSASLLSRDARRMQLLAMLNHSVSFLRSTSDLARVYHVILTTITALWGLRLNRAVLLMMDDWRQVLQGAMGIGQLTHEEAEQAWREAESAGFNDPLRYLAFVRDELPPQSALHKLAIELRIPVPPAVSDPFFAALHDPLPRLLSGSEIPDGLSELLQPESDVVVAPLMVGGRALGVIVGDNKFTREGITEEERDILRSFCDAAASTIQNNRRDHDTYIEQQRLRELLAHSEKIAAPEAGLTALERILKHSVEAAQADAASVIILDDSRQLRQLIAWPHDRAGVFDFLCVHRITSEVRRTRRAWLVEDLNQQRDELNPDRFASEYGAAACFPVRSPTRLLAVLWLFYKEARRFPEGEIQDLQRYFNLAGITYDAAQGGEETEKLLAAASAMSAVFKLDEVLQVILEQACRITGAVAATVWPWDEGTDKFLLQWTRSVGIPLGELRAPAQGQVTYRILQKGYESSGDPWKGIRQSPATQELLQRHDIQSYQGIVLKVGDEPVGVLYVSYKGDNHRRSFWAWERRLLESYSVFAALALRRGELWQQLDRVERGVEAVANVTVRGKLKKTLKSLAEQARVAADCDAVTLYSWDAKESRIRFPPVMDGVWFPDRVEKYDEQPLNALLDRLFASDTPSINDPEFRKTRFACDENIHTCLAFPLMFAGKEKTGLLFINYRNPAGGVLPREISHDDVEILKLLARQAAVTMHHALLIEQRTEELETSNRIRRGLEALNEAARAIIGKSRDEVLKLIVQHAVQCVHDESRRGTILGALLMFEADANSLVFREVYPPPAPGRVLFQSVGDRIRLDKDTGITRRAALRRKPQRVADVAADDDYVCYSADTRSELAVPLLQKDDDLIGVLDVESDKLDFFDEHDEKLLTALAELAVIATETDRLRRNAEDADKRVISELAKGCHDIITPMNGISVLLQNFLGGIHGKLTDGDEDLAREAVQRINETSQLIEDIVDIARLRSGMKTRMKRDSYNVGRLLKEVRSDHAEHAKNAGIVLELDPPEGVLDARIYVRALRRALNNLIRNALRFTPRGGNVWLGAYRQGDEIVLFVRDNGPGIDPTLRDQIFELGFTQSGSGSGLGLTIAKEFIELHDGRITVEGSMGEGAKFRIILPVGAQEE